MPIQPGPCRVNPEQKGAERRSISPWWRGCPLLQRSVAPWSLLLSSRGGAMGRSPSRLLGLECLRAAGEGLKQGTPGLRGAYDGRDRHSPGT